MKSVLLSKEKLCPYIHESLELHGSPWKLMIANTSGGEGRLVDESTTMSLLPVSRYDDLSTRDILTDHRVILPPLAS